MRDAVIFDIDGTLLDTVDLHAESFVKALTHFGVDVEHDAVRDQIGKGADNLLPVFLSDEQMERELQVRIKLEEEIRAGIAHGEFVPFYQPQICLDSGELTGFEVLDKIRNDEALSNVPVVVFTGRELSAEEDAQLHTMARSIVVKGVESPERLLDETSLFLHRIVTELPQEKQRMLDRLTSSDEDLVGRTDSGQPVRDDDDRTSGQRLGKRLGHRGLGRRIKVRGRFIEDNNPRAGQQQSRDRQPLPFTA